MKIIKIVFLFLIALITALGLYYFKKKHLQNSSSFDYFYTNCKMFDKSGHLVYQNSFIACDYHSSGSLIAANPDQSLVSFIDKNDKTLWSLNTIAHHNLMFTPDESKILIITENNFKVNSTLYRADCFEIYDLNGTLLHEWCMKDHIDELRKIGLDLTTTWTAMWLKRKTPDPVGEISHANSFYEIPENTRGLTDPIFKKGNYIVNLYGPSKLVLIFDENLQKILWSKNLRAFHHNGTLYNLDTHDVQVNAAGDILLYNNSMHPYSPLGSPLLRNSLDINLGIFNNYRKQDPSRDIVVIHDKQRLTSSLLIFDPYTDEIKWMYESDPPNLFSSRQLGSVTELTHKHYLFNNNTQEISAAYEIDSQGKTVWHYRPENYGKKDQPFLSIRPLTKLSFLKNRHINE